MDKFDLVGEHMDMLFMCVCDTVCYTERHNDTEGYDFEELLGSEEKMASFVERVNRWLYKIHPSLDRADAEAVETYVKWLLDEDENKDNFEYFDL